MYFTDITENKQAKCLKKGEQVKLQNYHKQLQAHFEMKQFLKQLPKKFSHVSQIVMTLIKNWIIG